MGTHVFAKTTKICFIFFGFTKNCITFSSALPSSETRVIYEAWRSNRPDNGDHHCVEMRKNQDRWDDSSCTATRRTLCQIG